MFVFSVQTSIVTRVLCGVEGAGLQRAIKSGLGRPMAFLKMSVRKEVVRRVRTGECESFGLPVVVVDG